jgi:hypothetical protein
MKYYCIQKTLDRKTIGHYPQVKDVIYNCNVDNDPRFIEHVYYTKIDFEPIVANPILYSSSRPTDLVQASRIGFSSKLLVSSRLKSILESFRTTGLQFFRNPLVHRSAILDDYWILNFYEVDMQFIDYANSDVYVTENVFDYIEKVSFSSFSEFNNKLSEISKVGYPKGIMIERFDLINNPNQDFFILLNVYGGVQYLISDSLKHHIESAGCNGIAYRPSDTNLRYWRG